MDLTPAVDLVRRIDALLCDPPRMKRLVLLEVDVEDAEELRRVARGAAYGVWAVLDDARKPVVMLARTEEADAAMRAAWDALPDLEPAGGG